MERQARHPLHGVGQSFPEVVQRREAHLQEAEQGLENHQHEAGHEQGDHLGKQDERERENEDREQETQRQRAEPRCSRRNMALPQSPC